MLRALVKDSAIYAVGTVASRLVGFIMIPVYTRVLTPADYGVIETIIRLVDIIGLFLALGLAEALLRHYYLAKDEEDRRRLVSTAFNLNLILVTVGSLLMLPLSSYLTRVAFGHDRYTHYVAISLVGMLIGNLIELPLTLWRAEGKAWRFTMILVLRLISQLATNIMLVVWLRWGVWGVLLSGLMNAVLWSAILGWLVRRQYGISWDRAWLQRILAYGLPLIPVNLSQFVLHFSDRFFLTRYATESELGLYSLSYRYGMLVSVFIGVMSRAWGPWAYSVENRSDADHHLQRATSLILLSSSLFAMWVAALSRPLIETLSAPPFWRAADYVPLLAIAYWFFNAQEPLSVGARLARRTDLLALANVAAAGICLLLNFLLIPRFGASGAVWTTFIALAVLAGASYAVSWTVRPVRLEVLSVFVCSVVLFLGVWLAGLRVYPLWFGALLRIGLAVVITGAVLMYGGGTALGWKQFIMKVNSRFKQSTGLRSI